MRIFYTIAVFIGGWILMGLIECVTDRKFTNPRVASAIIIDQSAGMLVALGTTVTLAWVWLPKEIWKLAIGHPYTPWIVSGAFVTANAVAVAAKTLSKRIFFRIFGGVAILSAVCLAISYFIRS